MAKVLLTGGYGFLGKYVKELLDQNPDNVTYIPKHSIYDLTLPEDCWHLFKNTRPEIVINLAANVGGIGYNQNHPYHLFYDNLMIGTNVIQMAIDYNVKQFIQVGTVCSYPKFAKPPFKEEMLWDGYPEETNAPYGLAKKMQLIQLQAAWQEFNFNSAYLIISNLYGPGDQFADHKSHVIPALIKRFVEAKEKGLESVEVWGSGNASRDFLHVRDAARAIISAIDKNITYPSPYNVGSGQQTRIAVLVEWIREMVGYKGQISWNVTRPDGQPARGLNIDKAKKFLDWEPEILLREGLRETIEWYKKTRI